MSNTVLSLAKLNSPVRAWLCHHQVLVFAFPRVFAVGSYEFPFAYQSHASLPGVLAMDQQHHHHHLDKKNIRDLHATIAYSVRATLDEGYWFDRCLSSRLRHTTR